MKHLADDIVTHAIQLGRMMRKRHTAESSVGSLNWQQMHALSCVRENRGLTMKEFANSLQITSPSATAFIERLVKMGFVERFTDEKNRKLVRLRISTRGNSTLTRTLRKRRERAVHMLSLLSAKDQLDLARILRSLEGALSKHMQS